MEDGFFSWDQEDSEGASTGEESTDEEAAATEDGTQTRTEWGKNRHRRFVLNRSGVAFDIKLIMLLMNTAIPCIALGNVFAHRRLVQPIVVMSQAIRDFCDVPQEEKAEQLMVIESLPIHSRNEIGELYRALNEMATNITNFVEEQREKDRLQAELVVAQKTSENKSNFLSSVSHELRTPINAVLGLDEMILRESTDATITEYAVDIQNAGKSLLGLVNDILDSSKLDEGKMELIPTEYELSSAVNDLVNMISVKAEDKGLALHVNVDEYTPYILYGDEVRLKQVILNILTNAVKYTEEGSVTMDIGYEKVDDSSVNLLVSVTDTGIGIREEDMDKLFRRFERIEESRNKNIEGTGLGMNIVQRLLALMGSELGVESVYGEGSRFSFAVRQQVVRWDPIGNLTEAYQKALAGKEEYEVSFIAPEAKVLVVDDTPLNLTVVKGLLKDTRIQITTAESGREALGLVENERFDLIFLDHRMPEMDGVETFHVMERMTESGQNQSAGAPVVALTANAVSGSREAFLKEGFTDYLSKPIDSRKLEKMVWEYLPDELLQEPVSAEPESSQSGEDGIAPPDAASSGSKLGAALRGITSIDYDTALQNCGTEELLVSVLSDYLEAIPDKHKAIADYFKKKDYQNYTILVHALKSSSRLIGATQLSEDAAHLEACGDRAKEGDAAAMQEIAEKTPALLKLYRSYYDKLTPLLSSGQDTDLRPELGIEELQEGLSAIREFVDAFDFDSADGVMTMLLDYRIPAEEAERFEEIRRKLSAVDREALLGLL